jgi:hypothetical protein
MMRRCREGGREGGRGMFGETFIAYRTANTIYQILRGDITATTVLEVKEEAKRNG